jgi:HlyD family secretion protein
VKRVAFAIAIVALAVAAALHAYRRRASGEIATFVVGKTQFTRRVTAEGNLRAVTSTPIVAPDIDGVWHGLKIAWLAPDGSEVHTNDVVVRFDRADVEAQLRDARVALESADASLRDVELQSTANDAMRADAVELATHQLEQIRKQQAKDTVLFSRNQITEGELDEHVAAATQLQAERARKIDRDVWSSNVELAVLAKQRAALAVTHATAALDHLEVRAPQDGILVLHRDDHGDLPKLGAQLCCNQPVAEIPALGAMEAELFVLESDGRGLEAGLPADVIVASRPELAYHGTIRLVDKLAKPRVMWVPVQYFSVVVELASTDRTVMKPGQRVHATLVLDSKDAITVPRQAVFDRDGKSIVYRRGAHGFEPVTVELGVATPGLVAITSGLTEGDVIAERDPTQTETGSGSAQGAP